MEKDKPFTPDPEPKNPSLVQLRKHLGTGAQRGRKPGSKNKEKRVSATQDNRGGPNLDPLDIDLMIKGLETKKAEISKAITALEVVKGLF